MWASVGGLNKLSTAPATALKFGQSSAPPPGPPTVDLPAVPPMRAASGGARRVPQPPPTGEPSEGPSAEDLAAPQSFVEAATASGLLALVQQSQETCVQVAALFDDIFEYLLIHHGAGG